MLLHITMLFGLVSVWEYHVFFGGVEENVFIYGHCEGGPREMLQILGN
jgi:hypothetical protein